MLFHIFCKRRKLRERKYSPNFALIYYRRIFWTLRHTLSELAAIKQDAKHFGYQMLVMERQKRATLEPLYRLTSLK